jgi:hypothetical protein
MQSWSKVLLFAALSGIGLAIPVQESPRQRLLEGYELPAKYRKTDIAPPYTPGNKGPLDRPVDAVGDKLDPLPWRNGLGASVLGPWNWERSRQSPDLVRPPSTDHGNMMNMRWSFADSHVRIEVRYFPIRTLTRIFKFHRKVDGRARRQFENLDQVSSLPA